MIDINSLDLSDRDAVTRWTDTHSDEENWELAVVMLKRLNRDLRGTRELMVENRKRSDNRAQTLRSIELNARMQALGHPILPVAIDGKTYPDDMPKNHRRPGTIDQFRAIPDEYLNSWLRFYNQAFTEDTTHEQKVRTIWSSIGGASPEYHADYMLTVSNGNERKDTLASRNPALQRREHDKASIVTRKKRNWRVKTGMTAEKRRRAMT
ncbi:hypothetical protein CI109_104858 [Kwoniella shandongensis]|uniref:Uncharacterized protein n=1 Tax=Kwoniella shandongensis TaxID=1734106 RepID=A0A5M6BRE2_9TREE|nr:uncharacterized protein CI109_006157 [Kwoniella shandongensis]KAA5525466.1 hypothetical protein CI109_006157 [Kwoniella shandongensis]